MKHPAAYYLLLLYSTLMIRCAMPVACDTLSHLFNEEAHIATIHAVYGSHHLQTEVASAVSDTQPVKHTGSQAEPIVVHTYSAGYMNVSVHNDVIPFQFPFFSYSLSPGSLLYINKPPESC